jgi:hypothetical protein
MPRWASRITLEVTALRVERVQAIDQAQAMAEGIDGEALFRAQGYAPLAFERLWESINGVGSWANNPWVWVVEFRRADHRPCPMPTAYRTSPMTETNEQEAPQ